LANLEEEMRREYHRAGAHARKERLQKRGWVFQKFQLLDHCILAFPTCQTQTCVVG
jgi:hypothetical protein